jgi:hypothetical protein
LGENWVKNQLEDFHLCKNQKPKELKIENFILKKGKTIGFSYENPNPVLKVLNKFGSLVPLVLLFTWGYWLFSIFFSLKAVILLFLLLLFSSYFYYFSSIILLVK